jgi:hypothetical protein
LIQEIILYLGSFIRTEPRLFNGILRVRIHHIIIAMREEISRIRGCDEEESMEFIMQVIPCPVKHTIPAPDRILTSHDYLSA